MKRVTGREFRTIREAVDFYMQDIITEKGSLFYNLVQQSNNISIVKENDSYLIVKKVKYEEQDEKRNFILVGKLKEDEVFVNIDETISQGPYNYERIRRGNYTINEDNTIKKEYSHLYTMSIDDKEIPIQDGTWVVEEKFTTGENNLISNYENIVPVKNKIKSFQD